MSQSTPVFCPSCGTAFAGRFCAKCGTAHPGLPVETAAGAQPDAPQPDAADTDAVQYKCPNCAAPILFDSKSQKMICHSCGTEMELEAFNEYEAAVRQSEQADVTDWRTYHRANWDEDEIERIKAQTCTSCGGELMMERTTIASDCPYCGNATVVPSQVSENLRPDLIIPFKLDREAAKTALAAFYKRKPLLPKSFKDQNFIDKITGIYVPFWLYDCDTSASAVFNATRMHTWRGGDYEYTRTDHFLITRSGDMSFEKVPADGSIRLDDTMMESIEPFVYSETEPFKMAYLSGYLADRYDIDAEACKPRVNVRIRSSVEAALRATVHGYASVSAKNMHINIRDGSVRYALFPVWLLNTVYKGQLYTFAMNGQTGKLIGDLPVDAGRAWSVFGIVTATVAAFGAIAGLAAGMTQGMATTVGVLAAAAAVITGFSFIFLPKRQNSIRRVKR